MANPTSIRLPDGLRSAIEERATVERRSFSNTVRVLLEDALAAQQREDEFVRELRETFHAVEVEAEG